MSGMASFPMHLHVPLAQWLLPEDDDRGATEVGARSLLFWPDIGAEPLDTLLDSSASQEAYSLAVYDSVGYASVDSQEMTLYDEPSVFGIVSSGQPLLGAGFHAIPPEQYLHESYQVGCGGNTSALLEPVLFPAASPDQNAYLPANAFTPGVSVFPVAFPQVSHAMDE